ncbi:MAG: thioesterase family protein [Pseudomonadota bacterium]
MTNSNIFKDTDLQSIALAETPLSVWNQPPQHVGKLTVQASHLDEFKHTNNTIYLVWMQAIAALHSEQLGLTFKDFADLGYGCVARQHNLEYKRPTFEGDTLWIATWISHNDGKADMTRQYQFVRESDQATVMLGHTQWVCIDMLSGRPKRQPPRFVEAYKAVQTKED